MTIRILGQQDAGSYAWFRREMWPINAAAGHWEAMQAKYTANPLSVLCPGSGVYGYFQDDRLVGVIGAYPMPVTLDGSLHPGHLLVDLAVLPAFRDQPAAVALFTECMRLPGRKYASYGTPQWQKALSHRGKMIPSANVTAIIRPFHAVLAGRYQLQRANQAAPIGFDHLHQDPNVRLEEPAKLNGFQPGEASGVAFVLRNGTFWSHYCSHRVHHGAVALRVETKGGVGQLVVNIRQSGAFRFANLLDFAVQQGGASVVRPLAHCLNRFLRALKVCTLTGAESDDATRELLRTVGVKALRRPAYWWALAKRDDSFAFDQVRWRLTGADRDSHWGGLELLEPEAE